MQLKENSETIITCKMHLFIVSVCVVFLSQVVTRTGLNVPVQVQVSHIPGQALHIRGKA